MLPLRAPTTLPGRRGHPAEAGSGRAGDTVRASRHVIANSAGKKGQGYRPMRRRRGKGAVPPQPPGGLPVEVGVEYAHPADRVDRQTVAPGRLADRLRGRAVVDAEGLRLVLAHIGVDPGDAVVGV